VKNGFVSVNFGCVARRGVGQSLGKAAIVSMYLLDFDAACIPTQHGGSRRGIGGTNDDESHFAHTSLRRCRRICHSFGADSGTTAPGFSKVAQSHVGFIDHSGGDHSYYCICCSGVRGTSRAPHSTADDYQYGVDVHSQFVSNTSDSDLPYEEEITPTPVSFMLAGGFFKKLRLFSRKIVGSSLVKSMRGVCTQSNAQ